MNWWNILPIEMEGPFWVVTLKKASDWRPFCLWKKPQTPNLDKIFMIMKLLVSLVFSEMQQGNQGDAHMPTRKEANLLRLFMALDVGKDAVDSITLAWTGGWASRSTLQVST